MLLNIILIPFFGTALGCLPVLLMKKSFKGSSRDLLTAFSAGIMVAASVWSLIMPALEDSSHMGKLAFLPAAAGLISGALFMTALGSVCQRLIRKKSDLKSENMITFLAVTIHNIPEGMAVGSVCASALLYGDEALMATALALSFGIAVQNIPEGSIIALPLYASGMKRGKAFLLGIFSGAVEPLGALAALIAAGFVGTLLPYFLCFAAGTMLFVSAQSMLPGLSGDGRVPTAGSGFIFGFMIMMCLDVAL